MIKVKYLFNQQLNVEFERPFTKLYLWTYGLEQNLTAGD
jgi:hypothetical protein